MVGMFNKCSSLLSLPDISKWNISKLRNISVMFYECNSLISFPDVSIWNNHSRLTVFNMFYKCNSLISPPDIYEPKISKGKMVGGRNQQFYIKTESTFYNGGLIHPSEIYFDDIAQMNNKKKYEQSKKNEE